MLFQAHNTAIWALEPRLVIGMWHHGRMFARDVMGRRINFHIGSIELFLIPASAPRLM